MARAAFPIYTERKTKKTGKTREAMLGWVTCTEAVAKFLDIEGKALGELRGKLVYSRKDYSRSLSNVDGSKDTSSASGGNTNSVQVAGTAEILSRIPKGAGGKAIRLQTDKPIANTTRKNKKAFHQISMRFPSWATNLEISDFLATAIPENKIESSSGTGTATAGNNIKPYFITESGSRYPILTRQTAIQMTAELEGSETASNEQEYKAISDKKKARNGGGSNP